MATITEDYVSFETAKLLKEKGFDEVCYRIYDTKEEELLGTDGIEFQNHEVDEETITAPTLQMAMKWLREVHHIAVSLYPYWPQGDMRNAFYWKWLLNTLDDNRVCEVKGSIHSDNYEKTCEAAIKYCLENLI